MPLQYITDTSGTQIAIMIPIDEWKQITLKHQDLKELETVEKKPKRKLSELAGKLSAKTAEAMHKYVDESRGDWDKRIDKQF
jgi:hypothetical protein